MKLDEKQRQTFEKKMLVKGQVPSTLAIITGVSAPAIRRLLSGGAVSRSTFVRLAASLEKLPNKLDPELLRSA